MQINNKLRLLVVVVFLSVLFLAPLYSLAGNAFEQNLLEPFDLNAKIMSIDLVSGFAIMAEKEIILPFRYEKGVKEFIPLVVNQDGTKIDIRELKVKDRVVVHGVIRKDELIAVKITLEVE